MRLAPARRVICPVLRQVEPIPIGQVQVKQAIKQVKSIGAESSCNGEVFCLFETEEETVHAAKRLLHAG